MFALSTKPKARLLKRPFTCARWLIPLCLVILGACHRSPEVQFFGDQEYPQKLSAWGLMQLDNQLIRLPSEQQVYELNTPLFTDYALKLRTLYLPVDTSISYRATDAFDFPVGSIISKTFFYPVNSSGAIALQSSWNGNPHDIDLSVHRLIETRLLVRQPQGWDALSYIWRNGEAYLSIIGDLITLPVDDGSELNYLVPSRNQCAGCHAENHTHGTIHPIGLKARHLNRPHPIHARNQLLNWQQSGDLSGAPQPALIPRNARWGENNGDLNLRARAYLDMNCGHCHNPRGAADTSGLMLDHQASDPAHLGICKPPIASGRGSGGHLYDIVPGNPELSILAYRMSTTDPAAMMPELGRARVHREGLTLIEDWIASLSGVCL